MVVASRKAPKIPIHPEAVGRSWVSSLHSIAVAPERNLDLLRAIAVLLVVICHLFGVSERTRRMQC